MAQSPPGLQVHQSQPAAVGDKLVANDRVSVAVQLRPDQRPRCRSSKLSRRIWSCCLRSDDVPGTPRRVRHSAVITRDTSLNCWQARPSRLLLRHLTGGPRPPLQAGSRPPDTIKLAALLPDAVAAQLGDGFFRGLRVRGEVGDAMGFQLAMVLTNDRTSELSPMRRKCLRSSTTPASSPPSS